MNIINIYLEKIFSRYQYGFIKNKQIRDYIQILKSLLQTYSYEISGRNILFLDQRKVYDSVNHEWLFKCI